MNLPPLNLPEVQLPFEVASMLHPLAVHFALVLPIVVLVFEIINLMVKKRTVGILAFLLMLLATASLAISYITGNVDANSMGDVSMLQEHKLLGTYLLLLSALLVILKLFAVIFRAGVVKALYLLLLIVLSVGISKLAIDSVNLVYKSGLGVEKVSKIEKVLDSKDKIVQELKKVNEELSQSAISKDNKIQELSQGAVSKDNQIEELKLENRAIKDSLSELKVKLEEAQSVKTKEPVKVSEIKEDINGTQISAVSSEVNSTIEANITTK
jgi:uncharacterized membrane protein